MYDLYVRLRPLPTICGALGKIVGNIGKLWAWVIFFYLVHSLGMNYHLSGQGGQSCWGGWGSYGGQGGHSGRVDFQGKS